MNYTAQLKQDGNLLARPPKKAKSPPKPLPRVSKKRAKQLREYAKRRRAFLDDFRYCQAWETIMDWLFHNEKATWKISPREHPKSTEIHHMKKPKCKYLNDETTWLAVSRWAHNWIEDHKNIARELGLLCK